MTFSLDVMVHLDAKLLEHETIAIDYHKYVHMLTLSMSKQYKANFRTLHFLNPKTKALKIEIWDNEPLPPQLEGVIWVHYKHDSI